MTALSLFRRKSKGQAPEPTFTPYELAKVGLKRVWDAASLERYCELESDTQERINMAWRFLFNYGEGSIHLADHKPYETPVFFDMEAASTMLRFHLHTEDFDTGFLQNIAVWSGKTRNIAQEYGWCSATSSCVTRMAAVERTFRAEVSDHAVEVAIAFFRHILTSAGPYIGDPDWRHVLAYMKCMAIRRTKKGLTRDELMQLRDAAVPHHHDLALTIQREIAN